jgi:predicted AAA+ superfamily ATPase
LSYHLNQYFEIGGYPEWFKIKDMAQWRRVLVDDYFSLILFRDIVSVFRVKDPILLEKLVREIAVFSTNRFSYRGLSERLGVDRETLKLYLYYLRSSMLIAIADVYYWKNKHEVDFIYDESKLLFPVEVKYREHPVTADTKGLIEFMRAFDLNIGIIVTKEMLKQEKIADKEIIFIPLWLFLLFL